MKGGSLRIQEIYDFLKASYSDYPPNNIGVFSMDMKLSNITTKVYVSKLNKKVIIIFRGTKEIEDWKNNLAYLVHSKLFLLTERFLESKSIYQKAKRKYKDYIFELLGHSQGGIIAHLLGKDAHSIILLNSPYKNEEQYPNEYSIRSSLDIISMNRHLYKYIPNHNMILKNNITIPSKKKSLIKQHIIKSLEDLPPNLEIGTPDKSKKAHKKTTKKRI